MVFASPLEIAEASHAVNEALSGMEVSTGARIEVSLRMLIDALRRVRPAVRTQAMVGVLRRLWAGRLLPAPAGRTIQ